VHDLDPTGVVQIASEEWSAETVTGTVFRGNRVRVVSMDGLKLKVEPAGAPSSVAPGGEGRQG